jgi:hypothetical protein
MPSINNILRYFDLQSQRRGKPIGHDASTSLTVFPQYIALVLGIIAQPFMASFQTTGVWDVTFESLINWSVFAIITGLLVFPGVYRKAFDAGQPKFIQWCAIFAAGIGWKSLISTAAKAVVPPG